MSVYPICRNEGAVPIYRQIRDWLANEIKQNYQSGDTLPSEIKLAKQLGVNRHTLRRGVDELVMEGVLSRRHGVGVIVLETAINYSIETTSRFTESLTSLGHQTSTKVVEKLIIEANQTLAKKLSLPQGERVICIETLRTVEQKPFCLITHYIPFETFQPVMESYNGGSLHEFLKLYCNTQSSRYESLVTAVLPSAQEAIYLCMPKNEPVLRVKSINKNCVTGNPIEYAVTRFRASSAQLSFKP